MPLDVLNCDPLTRGPGGSFKSYLHSLNTCYDQHLLGTYTDRNVAVTVIDRSNCKSTISCHCTMDGTVGQKGAVDIVWCITWDRSNHVCWICNTIPRNSSNSALLHHWLLSTARKEIAKTKIWHQFTYVLQVEGLFEFLHKMILQQRAINKVRNCLNMVYNSRDLQQG